MASNRLLQSIFVFKKVHLLQSLRRELFTFPSVHELCGVMGAPDLNLGFHGYLIKCGFGSWVAVGNSLVSMYARAGWIGDAVQVFEQMPTRDAFSYNCLICGFGYKRYYDQVITLFDQMLELGFLADSNSACHVMVACGELGSIDRGKLIHDFVIQNGLASDIKIVNLMISMYVRVGRLDLGRQVFNEMLIRDIVSWNSMIMGYARCGNWVEAFNLFLFLKKNENLIPSRVTFLALILACGQACNLDIGKGIHGCLICKGLLSDFRLGTSIIDMYSKCGRVDFAQTVFEEEMSVRSLISWNSLIAGYSQNGYYYEAIFLFLRMLLEENIKPDSITIANVVPAYVSLADLKMVKSIHAILIKRGLKFDSDVVLGTALIDAYGKCFDIMAAVSLFSCIWKPNTATWNAMISGYILNNLADRGLQLFIEMLRCDIFPDSITMVMLLQSCGELAYPKQGSMVHGYCFSKGFDSHLTVGNAMLDMYIRCGCIESMQLQFILMPSKNIVTWNTMLSGYVKLGNSVKALYLFSEMQSENQYRPDPVTLISIIQACATVSTGHGAEMVHAFTLKLGLDSETLVVNSLVDAYAKNGLIHNARSLFGEMGWLRDQSSWNVMIAGCGLNGQGEEACSLLLQMEEDGFKPNSVTFLSLLSSCSHSGFVGEGCRYFDLMFTKYGIKPTVEHWTCIIDMFGRAGRMEEAYQLIKHVILEASDSGILSGCDAVWGALLSACNRNMNMELGELAGEQLLELAPHNCGYFTLLSNLYASFENWDKAAIARRVFEDGRLIKNPGLSLVKM